MDSPDPQDTPGVNHDGLAGPILTSAETGADLNGWSSTTELTEGQKDVSTASRLLFLTVEYVEEHTADYEQSAFAGFEPGTPFSLQPPASLSEFEHSVSPLDPNMGSTARYSPVYTISGHSDSLSVSRERSSSSTTVSSNPSSPFPGQVVVLNNPTSPLMNPPSNTLPASPSFTENSHAQSPLSRTVVASPDIAQGFVNHMLSNPVSSPITCTSSSTDGGDGLLRQVVADDGYFNQQASSTTGSVLPGGLGSSPLNPNSPHSPLQAPLTPADNYVVSSSTEALDAMGPRPSDFPSDVTISVVNSPVVDSTSEIMIHSSMQQANEMVGATDASPFNSLETAGVMSTTHDVQLKHDPLDRVQLLLSSNDVSIAYSLDGQTSFMPTRLVDMGNDLAHRATDEVINSLKTQGLVIGEGENGDLQLRPSQTGDANAEEKLTGSLGLQEFTLAVRQQQSELLQQTLLSGPLNGDLTDSVEHLSESLLNDAVKISIVDPNLETVGAYTDILMESVSNSIGNEISGNSLIQQSTEICSEFSLPNSRTSKLESGLINSKGIEDNAKTLRNVANCNTFNDGCCSYFNTDVHKSLLDCALSSLPPCYLTISKLPINKAKESDYGVFARKTIPKRTQFGPVEGILIDTEELIKKAQSESERNLIFLIESESGQVQKLQLSCDGSSNWMTYVRTASCFKEQNLILNQQGQSLYFTTTKVIHPKQELRVWYSLPYARKHGLPSLLPMKFDTQGFESLKTWSCFQCNKNFANPVYLQCHLNIHELDKIKEVNDGKSAEKENHNLNQKNVPTFHSKKLKNLRTKCESFKCECRSCDNDLQQKCISKKCHASHTRSRKYLCEVCGYQFSQPYVRNCHVRRRLKDTNMNESSEQVPGFPRTKLDVPRKGIGSQDLCCPKCMKREEISDAFFIDRDISKEIQTSQQTIQSNSLPEEQILVQSSIDAVNNINDQTNFMETRVVDMNAEEFLSPEDDHQLNSVLNSFKLGDHKLTGSLDLQDLSLAVQQPQTDLLEQTLLTAPLNGDLTDSVVCFENYDDVKISIVDPNMETVGSFTDILLEPTCVENTISHEISDSSLPQQSPDFSSKLEVPQTSETECETSKLGDNLSHNSDTEESETSNNTRFQQVSKSVLARVSALLPASYLVIRKFAHNIGEESDCGVFARKTIRRKTHFGPIKGFLRMSAFSREINGEKLKHKLAFLVETGPDNVQALDISRKNAFNWMRFVRVAQSCNEQNVILSQRGRSLFLITTKVIHPKEELRVWYSLLYAKRHGLPFLQPLKLGLTGTCGPSSTWQCFKCSDRFVSSGDLQYHLNIHNLDALKMETEKYLQKATCALCSKKAAKRTKKKNKDYPAKYQNCKNQCRPCHLVQYNDFQKKQRSHSRKRKYSCEFCGFQFSHLYNRNRHVQRHHKDIKMNGTYKPLPANVKLIKPSENVKSKTNSAWYCSHCNQHFRSASVCNLHTLVHAAENVEETEVIIGAPNDFPTLPENSIESDLLCPQCTKKVETSDGLTPMECGVSKTFQPSLSENTLCNSQIDKEVIRSSGGSNVTFNLNNRHHFMDTRVDMNTSGFLPRNTADDHQLNSVLKSLKMQGLVIDEGENGDLQLRAAQAAETCAEDKLGEAIQLQELSLAVRQQESNILQQTLLGCPLNGDISRTVSHLNSKTPAAEGKHLRSCELKDCNVLKVSNNTSTHNKPVFTIASSSFPTAYLAIRKLKSKKTEKTVYGVFARKTLAKKAQFGPIEGIFFKNDHHFGIWEKEQEGSRDLTLSVVSESGNLQKLYINSGDSWYWMKYIRTASSYKEQNLVLNQNGQSLFFITTKVIHPKQELRVWYSLPYAIRRNLPLLDSDVPKQKNLEDMGKIWPCFECSENFTSSVGLQIHLNIHEFQRDEEDSLDKHIMKRTNRSFRRKGIFNFSPRKYRISSDKPSEGFPYQCHTCNRAFPKNYSLKRHQLLHTKDKKYACEVCGYQFSHVYNRDRHVRKRHKDLNMNGNSKLSAFLKKKLGLKSNSQNGNSTGMEWYCSYCSLGFDSLRVLNIHTLSHGNGEFLMDNEHLECPQCYEEFITKKELIDHVADHGKLPGQARLRSSSNPAKPWKCDMCYKSFATDDRLQRHMLVHGAEESKPLQCEICYKRFLNNSALACHIKIHTAEKKMFECPICKMVFDHVLSLKEHVHCHSENGVYTCPQCNKVFDGYSLIRKHIRAFHSDRKHTCNYCGKLFPKLDKLRMHMLRHSDHREFLCANCGKQFKRKDKLKEHMKRMHSAERELRLAMKPHRPPTAKKFMPKVSPTDYHRFIYKCHTCLLGFKRRGMLVNHLAKRHPDISPDSVPELNLPILKTTRDYYCQYCEKVYKSSSKRKAHILKIHPGAELPMSNRRKGGVPEIPGFPNPTFSQTVGSITTHPHGCQWCHKQYASKAKLLQHQRKKHIDLLPQSQQFTGIDEQEPPLSGADQQMILPHSEQDIQHQSDSSLTQLQGIENVINIIPGDYHISTTEEDLQEFQESGIIIDTSALERPLKVLQDGISADLLSQAMSELTNEFRVSVNSSSNDHYLRIVQTSPGHITVTQSPSSPENCDKDALIPSTNAVIVDCDTLSPTSGSNQTSSQLHHLLSESYSLPSSPSPSPSPQTWANAHVTFTPYTAR